MGEDLCVHPSLRLSRCVVHPNCVLNCKVDMLGASGINKVDQCICVPQNRWCEVSAGRLPNKMLEGPVSLGSCGIFIGIHGGLRKQIFI